MMTVAQMLRGDKFIPPDGVPRIISEKFAGTIAIPQGLNPAKHGDAQRIKVLEYVAEYGEVTLGFLAEEMHIGPNAVQAHLDKLVALGALVKHEPEKRCPGHRNTWTAPEES